MGLFGESKKEREEREERALSAILKGFEEGVKNPGPPPDSKKSSPEAAKANPTAPATSAREASVEDLVTFLARKGVVTLSEWESYKSKNQIL